MSTASDATPLVIAGAGIGGLSAAIALAQRDIPCLILERADAFQTHGAGIQLGPNATRILGQWGVLDHLKTQAIASEGILIGDGRTGEILNSVPFGSEAEHLYGAPFLLAHRADLHSALLKTARKQTNITIELGNAVEGFRQDLDGVTVVTSKGNVAGAGLICADGLWSRLRDHVDEGAELTFAGKSAWRTLLDAEAVPEPVRAPWTRLWMGPKAHLVHYPVCGGSKINVVAVIDDPTEHPDDWQRDADSDHLLPAYEGWNVEVAELVRTGEGWRKWSLYSMPPLRNWTLGRVCLLGDAAHPVLPFLAQGGALAIEDAAVLANIVAGTGLSNLDAAFRKYEGERIARTARTSYESRKMGRIYGLSGLAASARNFVLRYRKPAALRKRYDWLYGFRLTVD